MKHATEFYIVKNAGLAATPSQVMFPKINSNAFTKVAGAKLGLTIKCSVLF